MSVLSGKRGSKRRWEMPGRQKWKISVPSLQMSKLSSGRLLHFPKDIWEVIEMEFKVLLENVPEVRRL